MKDKVQGKFEEIKGDVTNDPGEELKGKARQKLGDVKEKGSEGIDRAEDAKNDK